MPNPNDPIFRDELRKEGYDVVDGAVVPDPAYQAVAEDGQSIAGTARLPVGTNLPGDGFRFTGAEEPIGTVILPAANLGASMTIENPGPGVMKVVAQASETIAHPGVHVGIISTPYHAEDIYQILMGTPAAYVVLDTETSGLPLFTEKVNGEKVTVAADDPRQPRLAQAYMAFLDADLELITEFDGYVRPDGWVMEAGATTVNGLTTEFLLEHGRPVGEILDVYARAVAGSVIVAHHAQFDCKIMRGEFRRAGRPDLFEQTRNFCTMRKWSEHNGGRWPKLANICDLLGIKHEDKHRANGDGRATVDLLRHFRRLEIPILGEVHTSKYHPGKNDAATDG